MTNLTTPSQISAQELRIGNWVLFASGGNFQINKGWPTQIGDGATIDEYWKFEPIPLTPEILEKAGFIQKKPPYGLYKFDCLELLLDDTTASCKVWVIGAGFLKRHIKYVHQLQNLYFALTGTELVINL